MYPNRILDADKDYAYTTFLDSIPHDFTMAKGDAFELYVMPEKGYNLIEPQIVFQDNATRQTLGFYSLTYTISQTGEANIPILGPVKLDGLTELEAEKMLSELYKQNYSDPLVNVSLITQKTATVYRGSSEAKLITLVRPNMTLLEVIAAAGGIPQDAKPSHIKVIRQVNSESMVEAIDLSEIDGLTQADNFIQPNDIIYIEPGINTQFFQEIAPIITVVSGVVIIYAYFVNLNSN